MDTPCASVTVLRPLCRLSPRYLFERLLVTPKAYKNALRAGTVRERLGETPVASHPPSSLTHHYPQGDNSGDNPIVCQDTRPRALEGAGPTPKQRDETGAPVSEKSCHNNETYDRPPVRYRRQLDSQRRALVTREMSWFRWQLVEFNARCFSSTAITKDEHLRIAGLFDALVLTTCT